MAKSAAEKAAEQAAKDQAAAALLAAQKAQAGSKTPGIGLVQGDNANASVNASERGGIGPDVSTWPIRVDVSPPGSTKPVYKTVYGVDVTFNSFPGGLNLQRGRLPQDGDRLSSSTAGVYGSSFVLNQLTTAATTHDPSASPPGIHHARIFGTCVICMGNSANNAIFT